MSMALPLSQRLRDSSAHAHAESDALVRRKAPLAFTNKKLWGALLSQFYWVYRTIEDSLEQLQGQDHLVSILPMLKRVRRSEAFLLDVRRLPRAPFKRESITWGVLVAYFTGAAPEPPMAATDEYIRAIQAAAKRGPIFLLVYAYTMYLALLAGGAILSRMLRAAMRLPAGAGNGAAIFDFDDAIPAPERKRFRENLKGALDSVGANLNEEQVLELVAEKCSIFNRNNKIIRDVLVARAPPAGLLWPLQLARAYALLLYGALMALLRFLLVELPVRVLTGVPRRVADWATGRNSGWVGH